MEREQAINAYRRVKDWEAKATRNMLRDLRRRGACDPIPLTLHNWGHCAGREPYKTLDRYLRWKDERITEQANRLAEYFARFF